MGLYINPPGMTKEQWLEKNGRLNDGVPNWQHDFLPVCLVNNGMFTAAGIAFSEAERDVFAVPDGRAKQWFVVERKKLEEIEPALKGYK